MLMGFLSLLLTVGQGIITDICVPKSLSNSWHPCKEKSKGVVEKSRTFDSKVLVSKCKSKNMDPFLSYDGLHQLHIFIFTLAVFHVLYCLITMLLSKLKMKIWKSWENEAKTAEYQFSHDPNRFRLARNTSFIRRHLGFWSESTILIWVVCFFRQFVSSVPKIDFLTLRHGFIMAHLAPQSSAKFDFQKYIKRSLEEDFKVVVGISPALWLLAVFFLLFNIDGWYSYLWLPFIPLIVILLVGTKLQVIITKMAMQIVGDGDVIKGDPVVQPTDELFWFKHPHLLLHLIHFVLFQNAFQLAFFTWTWYEFGYPSCFHRQFEDILIRISLGILVQVLCSYVTLPLYALVTQMGSNIKPTIFSERVEAALRKWHEQARNRVAKNHRSMSSTWSNTSGASFSLSHSSKHLQSFIDKIMLSPRNSHINIDIAGVKQHHQKTHSLEGVEEADINIVQSHRVLNHSIG
ncbi:MLO-like protein 6 [Dioscorea cayenensis subsp. rotundata]|uniref:MLO-like protein n=1 Tax=Dioscorea cayennensis subsp. rotundata TaxID=55577 RepID=A0AB40C782_DIOCR|nr:MLO-like protein 6 [Dioscorea cayenensis subsp. rotundata]